MTELTFKDADIPSDEIVPESAKDTEPEPPGELACLTCGKTLTYAGRGRKPMYCDEHRAGGNRKGSPAVNIRASKSDKMRRELLSMFGMIGLGLTAIEPYDGMVVMDRAEPTVDALMAVAAENERVRKVLESMIEVGVWAALGTAVAGIALPIAAHHGVLPIPTEAVNRQFLSESTREALARMDKRKSDAAEKYRQTLADMSA
jgi:hypothetical protein